VVRVAASRRAAPRQPVERAESAPSEDPAETVPSVAAVAAPVAVVRAEVTMAVREAALALVASAETAREDRAEAAGCQPACPGKA